MIIKKIKTMVIELCRKDTWWRLHIGSVVKYSKLLAKKTNADEEVLEISAWLHDIQKIKGRRELHHVNGANEAEKILKKFGYPEDKIEKVKHCIITHSSDRNYPPESKEANILHNADALSHFDNFMAFAHFVYGLERLSVEDGRKLLINKYEKNWNKLTIPEARKLAKPKYEAIRLILQKQN